MIRFWESMISLANRAKNKAIARLYAWELKNAYEKGQVKSHARKGGWETVEPRIIERGQVLRQQVTEQYANKYSASGYRILFHMPPSGVGMIWFQDLMQCLAHAGIPCTSVLRGANDFRERWEAFQPNVFISMDATEVLRSLDGAYINQYKENHGCLRLFTPISSYRFPDPGLSSEDKWRLDLARKGKSVDAYFSMMAPEFFAEFWADWAHAGFKYLSLPNGCNPFRHYPTNGVKEFDYFMVTSYSFERAEVTRKYLKRIFERYYGLWAGPGWGFGKASVAPQALRDYYAKARIALNPLQNYLIRYYAETTERSFTATACGAFQITNWTPVTDRFWGAHELACVKNEQEFLDTFEYYVNRPDDRNTIVLRGLERVYREHTYFHRIDTLVTFLEECDALF